MLSPSARFAIETTTISLIQVLFSYLPILISSSVLSKAIKNDGRRR